MWFRLGGEGGWLEDILENEETYSIFYEMRQIIYFNFEGALGPPKPLSTFLGYLGSPKLLKKILFDIDSIVKPNNPPKVIKKYFFIDSIPKPQNFIVSL